MFLQYFFHSCTNFAVFFLVQFIRWLNLCSGHFKTSYFPVGMFVYLFGLSTIQEKMDWKHFYLYLNAYGRTTHFKLMKVRIGSGHIHRIYATQVLFCSLFQVKIKKKTFENCSILVGFDEFFEAEKGASTNFHMNFNQNPTSIPQATDLFLDPLELCVPILTIECIVILCAFVKLVYALLIISIDDR